MCSRHLNLRALLPCKHGFGFPRAGRSEGEAIGLEKGRSEGVAAEKREIAKNMKSKNIPNADIAEITGLSAEEIEKL